LTERDAKIDELRKELVDLKTQLYNTKQILRQKRAELKGLVKEDGKENVLRIRPREINKAISIAIKDGLSFVNEFEVEGEDFTPEITEDIGRITSEAMKNLAEVFIKTAERFDVKEKNDIE